MVLNFIREFVDLGGVFAGFVFVGFCTLICLWCVS